MPHELDFEGLAGVLLGQIRDLLPRWLPGGRLVGHEWSCGSLRGENGDSLKVNINSGKWADFAGNEKGGDLISLFAAIQGIGQGEAFKQLNEDHGKNYNPQTPASAAAPTPEISLIPPPSDAPAPSMVHNLYGPATDSWCYRDGSGAPMFYVARYDIPTGKQIVPWSWLSTGKWIAKGWPAPRPLYGLDQLALRPAHPVLIVEGEKAAEAARVIAGDHYIVMTWPNGSKAVGKTDWTPLRGRSILIFPDADAAGVLAGAAIIKQLTEICPTIKTLDTTGQPDGWDAADALADGWDWTRFKEWAIPRAAIHVPAVRVPMTATEILSREREHYEKPDEIPGERPTVAIQVNTHELNGPVSETQQALIERLGIACAHNGTPICNVTNVLRIIAGIPEYKELVWFDEFHQRYFTTWRTGSRREWSDIDDLNLTGEIQSQIGLHRMGDETVAKGIRMYAHQHIKNEPRDWMDSLTWDGDEHIAEFLTACMGVEPSDYAKAASRNFWIGMVARIYRPGCQLDNMLVLEGAQGIGKTRALRLIGGDWYTSAKENVQRDNFFLALHGKLLVEIAELDSFSRAEVTRIKQVVSDPVDRYRAPYDRRSQDHARMSIFVGTTNEENYLRDATGGRRFWPVHCGEVQYELIAKYRTQFFAEAVHRLKAGETWYQMPTAATKQAQESRRQVDEWEHIINAYLSNPTRSLLNEITLTEIAIECLKIDVAKLDKATQMRIASTLKALGYQKKLAYSKGDSRARVWVNNNKESLLSDTPGYGGNGG